MQKDEVDNESMYPVIDTAIEPNLSVHDTHCSVGDVVSQSDNDSENANEVLNDDRWDNSKKIEMVHKCLGALTSELELALSSGGLDTTLSSSSDNMIRGRGNVADSVVLGIGVVVKVHAF